MSKQKVFREEFEVIKSLEEFFVWYFRPKLEKGNLNQSRPDVGNSTLSLREHLGLVILAAFLTKLKEEAYLPAIRVKNIETRRNDQVFDDGSLTHNGHAIEIEQVYVIGRSPGVEWDGKVRAGVIDALRRKSESVMGKGYSLNKWLLIFCNAVGEFNPHSVCDEVQEHSFQNIVLIGPNGAGGKYNYYVFVLKDGGKVVGLTSEVSIDPTSGATTLTVIN